MISENKKLSLEPYKGTRDFYPKDQFIQNYISSVWRKISESFGYLEYGASILEETELYRAKTSEEIVSEQTYSFIDRGGREVTIRPEMTPSVARMVAQKRKELSFPLRWYSIPNLFRYERPQRGRLREHWQLNCDIFGVDNIEADAEIISLAFEIMKAFGAQKNQFEIRVNNRKSITKLFESKGLTADAQKKLMSLMDKKSKITDFDVQAEKILGQPFDEILQKEFLDDDIVKLEEILSNSGVQIKIDPYLVRGFDYYTGIVFEIYDVGKKNNRSLFGGGRYDNLVEIFGAEKVSGVGFGMGDVTIRDFLETYSLLPEYQPSIHLYIAHLEGFLSEARGLAYYLREIGLNVEVDITDRKVSAQVKSADRENIPYVIVVGEEEVKTGKFKLKNLKESKEQIVEKEGIAEIIRL